MQFATHVTSDGSDSAIDDLAVQVSWSFPPKTMPSEISNLDTWQYHLFMFGLVFTIGSIYQPSDWTEVNLYSISWIIIMSLNALKGFVMFHDCGHLSFIPNNPTLNRVIGEILSLFTVTPYSNWQKRHNKHHSIQGDLDKIDYSSTVHYTVNYIKNIDNKFLQLLYLIARFPPLFFVSLPFLKWWIVYPIRAIIQPRYILSQFGHLMMPLIFQYCHGYKHSFWIYFLISSLKSYFAAFIGIVLFHLQHSHNPSYRSTKNDGFSAKNAAIHGSTYHQIPWFMQFFTMGIEYHHLHHFDTKLPGYLLKYYQENIENDKFDYSVNGNDGKLRKFDKALKNVEMMTYWDSYNCLSNIAYCESKRRYITWSETLKQVYFV